MPIGPDMAALRVSSVMYTLASKPERRSENGRPLSGRTCDPTCQPVLRYETTDDPDVGSGCSLRPPDTVNASTIEERPEDELAALVFRGLCEDGNDKGNRAKDVPQHGNVAQGLENAHAKGVDSLDCTYVKVGRSPRNGHILPYLEVRGPRRRSQSSYVNLDGSSCQS